MTQADDLQARAKRRKAALVRAWNDPRFKRVIGRLRAAGVLTTTMDIVPHREAISIEDALWAGRTEPRVLELLPALIVKRPALFRKPTRLPGDLRTVVEALKRSEEPPNFRGIPGAALLRWLPSVGHRGKLPTRLRSFRFTRDDLELLARLTKALDQSQTEVVRRGLRHLAKTHLLESPDAPGTTPEPES